MPPPSPAVLYTTKQDISDLLSAEGLQMALDDDTSGVTEFNEARWLDSAPMMGTAQVNRFAQLRYDTGQLALSWSVWWWATLFGAEFVWSKRNQPIPATLMRFIAKAELALARIAGGKESIEDISQRVTDAIAWRNVRHDMLFLNHGIRVEQSTSDQTPAVFPIRYDYYDVFSPEQ